MLRVYSILLLMILSQLLAFGSIPRKSAPNALMVDAQGEAVADYTYDPFGNLVRRGGELGERNTMRFSSKEYHPRSGLYYYGFRYYDPNLQRWLNADPIGEAGGFNLHQFVGNDPLGYVDPDGLWFKNFFSNLGNALYDAAMGDTGQAQNQDSYGAQHGAMLGGIDLHDNPLQGSISEGVGIAGDWGTDYLAGLAMGKVFGWFGDLLSPLWNKAKGIGKAFCKAESIAQDAAKTEAALVRVGDRLTTVNDVLGNPNLLAGKGPAELQAILGKTPGWKIETLGQGSHAGQGWVLREYTSAGNPTGRMMRWHPGGGHHGPDPYWRVSGGAGGKSGIVPGGTEP